jgi:hypothetical protein
MLEAVPDRGWGTFKILFKREEVILSLLLREVLLTARDRTDSASKFSLKRGDLMSKLLLISLGDGLTRGWGRPKALRLLEVILFYESATDVTLTSSFGRTYPRTASMFLLPF